MRHGHGEQTTLRYTVILVDPCVRMQRLGNRKPVGMAVKRGEGVTSMAKVGRRGGTAVAVFSR